MHTQRNLTWRFFTSAKLLVPSVQIQIMMYFNSPAVWTMRWNGARALRLTEADANVKLYLSQVSDTLGVPRNHVWPCKWPVEWVDHSTTFKCARARCKTCPFICNVEKLSGPKQSIKITDHFTCTSGSTESRKTLEQKFIFEIGTLNPHGINEHFSFN